VERGLNVQISLAAEALWPGKKAKVTLKATDHLSNPVQAELSLAMVDEAVFSLYPDRMPDIVDYFEEDAPRRAEFRAASTCGFDDEAVARRIEQAYEKEAQRLEQHTAQEQAEGRRGAQGAAETAKEQQLARDDSEPRPSEQAQRGAFENRVADCQQPEEGEQREKTTEEQDQQKKKPARREMPQAGRWVGSVVTGEDGTAVVKLDMPEMTSRWRLTSRGCTVNTLLGLQRSDVVTRKDLFVSVKAPGHFGEGDSVRLISRVYNLTDYSGSAELTLQVYGGEEFDRRLAERSQEVSLDAG